jgi:cytochrome c oxidase subunit 3
MSAQDVKTDHSPWFRSASHEFESQKFGMWLFLVQELMLFGGLFVGFILYNYLYPEMFREAHHMLDKRMGAFNTVVLLVSSLTMVLAVGYTQRNEIKKAMVNIFLTFSLAGVFMVVKYFEYSHKIHDGLLPGKLFTNTELTHHNSSLFFTIYFMMTGLHGIHVVLGMVALLWILWRMNKGHFNSKNFAAVEFVGLYWHLVDLIWIFLFPLLYLVV